MGHRWGKQPLFLTGHSYNQFNSRTFSPSLFGRMTEEEKIDSCQQLDDSLQMPFPSLFHTIQALACPEEFTWVRVPLG